MEDKKFEALINMLVGEKLTVLQIHDLQCATAPLYVLPKRPFKFKVTEADQREMNKVRKKCGLPEEPIVPEYEMEGQFG